MSCYEWEGGTIKLPTKIFAKFRREYINEYNAIQEANLAKLKRWREIALRDGKGKRNYDFQDRMLCMCNGYAEEDLVYRLFDANTRKPKTPTKKMFNFKNGKDFSFSVVSGEAGIGFSKESHSVSWHVGENNHAVEHAHGTPEAKVFFRMLNRVDWTRGSGGTIVGNDEYNRDNCDAGGGGNYVTMTFGNRK